MYDIGHLSTERDCFLNFLTILAPPSIHQGAESSLYAATSTDLVGRNILFIHDNKEMTASVMARDPEVALKLWRASERRVQLGQHPEDKGCILSEP